MIPDLREIKKYIGFAILSVSVLLLYFFYPGSDSKEAVKQIETIVGKVKEVIPAKGGGREREDETNVGPFAETSSAEHKEFVMKGGSEQYPLFNDDSFTSFSKLLEFFIQ